MSDETYKGYTLTTHKKHSFVYVGKATKDGHSDIGCVGQRTEQEAVEELKRLIDQTEEEERANRLQAMWENHLLKQEWRVPGLGAFDRDWSGLKFKDRRRK